MNWNNWSIQKEMLINCERSSRLKAKNVFALTKHIRIKFDFHTYIRNLHKTDEAYKLSLNRMMA